VNNAGIKLSSDFRGSQPFQPSLDGRPNPQGDLAWRAASSASRSKASNASPAPSRFWRVCNGFIERSSGKDIAHSCKLVEELANSGRRGNGHSAPPHLLNHGLLAIMTQAVLELFTLSVPVESVFRRRNDSVVTFCDTVPMPVSRRPGTNREPLNIRIKPDLRRLIDRAAGLAGKERTDFVLDAARHAAEDTLLDRTAFSVSPQGLRRILGAASTSHRSQTNDCVVACDSRTLGKMNGVPRLPSLWRITTKLRISVRARHLSTIGSGVRAAIS